MILSEMAGGEDDPSIEAPTLHRLPVLLVATTFLPAISNNRACEVNRAAQFQPRAVFASICLIPSLIPSRTG